MRGRGNIGTVRPTGVSGQKRTAANPMVQCFRFRNYLSDQRLFDGGLDGLFASKFRLANCHFMGIVSVSRSVQSVNSARARTEARLQVPFEKPDLTESRIGYFVLL